MIGISMGWFDDFNLECSYGSGHTVSVKGANPEDTVEPQRRTLEDIESSAD